MDSYHFAEVAAPKGAPLLLLFHGTGGDENDLIDLGRQLQPNAHLISPRGDVSEGGALRFFRRTGEGVYDMADLAERTEKMAAFIAAHKAENPGRPVYGLGYSNGANILASVVFQHAGLFDRTALLHPLIPWTPAANPQLQDKAVLITAGQRDPICPLPLTEALIAYLSGQDARVEAKFHPGGHEIRQEELAALQAFLTR